ncbi:MAG: hypothetical protein KVP17_001206 [Porospora cf. gigantea B]|uniref:uncharacterized protein n=1 Tax=Porospora cf. gigantea B TaxID=2853592 RepID=UPI0035718804|nr:MAG: hypothetical protein KVP17_001206 [Porospora cf. gigantea B]
MTMFQFEDIVGLPDTDCKFTLEVRDMLMSRLKEVSANRRVLISSRLRSMKGFQELQTNCKFHELQT